MTKEDYRNYGYVFLLSSGAALWFLIQSIWTQTGVTKFVSCLLAAGLINFQLRAAGLMYREYRKNR